MTKPEQCPKYESCNANVCPLYERWRRTTHLDGERVCLWLREWSKAGGAERVRERLLPDLAEAVSVAHSEITLAGAGAAGGHGVIRRVLLESAKSGSKLAAGEKLRENRG